jgi:hypothetical protein
MQSELRKGTDFAVRAQALGTFDEIDAPIGKFALQLVNDWNGWIIERGDAKEKFEFSCVRLPAVRAEGVEHSRIEALKRLENGNGGCEGPEHWATRREKCARRDDGEEKVRHPRDGQNRG